MRLIAAKVSDRANLGKSDYPMLFMFDEALNLVNMTTMVNTSNGADETQAARRLVYLEDPHYAIYKTEMWIVDLDLPPTDGDRRRVELGEIRPSDLPRHKRGELIMLYGEARTGDNTTQMWRVRYADREHRHRKGADPLPAQPASLRFMPLFVVDHMVRTIRSTAAFADEPSDALRAQIRPYVGDILATDMGGRSSAEFEARHGAVTRRLRESVLRGGPAT